MKPCALDLFCGAGGATRGLQLAGFNVYGVDRAPQPNYIGDGFCRLDAMDFLRRADLSLYDLIWASPPCQSFSAYRRRDPSKVGAAAPNLIPAVRAALDAAARPYVIENVPGAPLHTPVLLCGSMFGLAVRRHRIFESRWFAIGAPTCAHHVQRGSYPQATNRTNRRRTVEIGVYRIPLDVQHEAMGIDWMTRSELSQAIPPAYARHIAESFLSGGGER